MKITQEEVVEHQTVLQIELEEEDLTPYLDRGYRRVAERTAIPGFRKGKAPRRIVENFVGRETLLNEVLDSMMPEVTGRAITEQELDVAGLPRIELLELEPLTLKATVPLNPDVDLGSYGDIRFAREPIEITEEDQLRQIDQLRHNMASWEPADRPIEMGDMVTIDATGEVDGRSVLKEKDAVFFLDEDGSRPFPGFSQHLVGLVLDKATEFKLAIPDDFGDQTIAGKEVDMAVTIGEIKRRVLPELDDDFSKSVGEGFETMEALRVRVESDLKSEAENRSTQQHREAVVKALLDGVSIELPPLLVEHETAHMAEEQEQVLSRVNVRKDDYLQSIGKTEEEVRNDLEKEAVARIKRSFVLSKVMEVEGVEVSDEEVEDRLKEITADSDERTRGQQDTEEMRSSIRQMRLMEKTLDRLTAIAEGEIEAAGADDAPDDADEGGETAAASEQEPGPEREEEKEDEGGDTDDTKP